MLLSQSNPKNYLMKLYLHQMRTTDTEAKQPLYEYDRLYLHKFAVFLLLQAIYDMENCLFIAYFASRHTFITKLSDALS